MKIIIVVVLVLLLFCSLFLFIKTFTVNKICGWEGIGKDWPCLCVGIKQISVESSKWTQANENMEIYYCTGLNLSCSEFALNNFYSRGFQKPISCEEARK